MEKTPEKPYPNWVCQECGSKESKKQFYMSTWHKGKCEVCGEEKKVTQPRDFYYPNFGGGGMTKTTIDKLLDGLWDSVAERICRADAKLSREEIIGIFKTSLHELLKAEMPEKRVGNKYGMGGYDTRSEADSYNRAIDQFHTALAKLFNQEER